MFSEFGILNGAYMTFIDWYFTGVSFLFGACWGSFLNVCIYRIPAELSVVKPRSRCPKCMTNLAWKDNIPIVGWIFLRGKCRYCKESISARYPSIELLAAVLFAWIYLTYPIFGVDGSFDFRAVAYGLLTFGLLLGSFVDIDELWIPDRVSIGGMIVGPILSFLIPAMHGAHDGMLFKSICSLIDPVLDFVLKFMPSMESNLLALIQSLLGLCIGFGSLWLVGKIGTFLLKKDAMGFGDVKLMGTLGAFLGWQSIIFIVFVSSLLGTVIGVTLIAIGNKDLQSKIPFGPYIALAGIIWFLGGNALWETYVSWIQGAAY